MAGQHPELRNVLERAVLLAREDVLTRRDLRFDLPAVDSEPAAERSLTLAELERRHIARVLADEGGHVERAARRLGVPRSSLYEKLKRHDLARP